MNKAFLFTGALFLACSIQAQDIFKKHGFEKETLTLSKGRYEEVFTNKEVVQIGSVLLNTKTNKVVKFLDEEAEDVSFKAEYSSRWLSPDPLAEKYPQLSPYVFCANNPLRYVDLHGDSINAAQVDAQQTIMNTLTKEDMNYVQFDKNGNINMDLLTSHKSESGNYNALMELASSSNWINVSVDDQFTYMDNNGNIQTETMSYQGPDPEFADPTGNTLNGTTTGEAGLMGQTLLPGSGTSGINSPDNTVKVIMNKNLSPAAKAEMYSHEANGHALMYIRTGDRVKSGHVIVGSKDTNTILDRMIIRSKQETVKNMQRR